VFLLQEKITMRNILRIMVLAPSLCVTACFAAGRASFDAPFSFESHGDLFPAGQYDVELDVIGRHITMSSRKMPKQSLSWIAGPAEANPNATSTTIRFDIAGTMHVLRIIRLGSYETPILDAHSK
jgi:hypothetical protein